MVATWLPQQQYNIIFTKKFAFFVNLRWLHVMTVENLPSQEFIEDWLSFHARIQLYCC